MYTPTPKRFEVRKPTGLHTGEDGVALVVHHNPNQSTVVHMTWDELRDLHRVLGESMDSWRAGPDTTTKEVNLVDLGSKTPPSERLGHDPIDDILLA